MLGYKCSFINVKFGYCQIMKEGEQSTGTHIFHLYDKHVFLAQMLTAPLKSQPALWFFAIGTD